METSAVRIVMLEESSGRDRSQGDGNARGLEHLTVRKD
jgi:hypothetical protein